MGKVMKREMMGEEKGREKAEEEKFLEEIKAELYAIRRLVGEAQSRLRKLEEKASRFGRREERIPGLDERR